MHSHNGNVESSLWFSEATADMSSAKPSNNVNSPVSPQTLNVKACRSDGLTCSCGEAILGVICEGSFLGMAECSVLFV